MRNYKIKFPKNFDKPYKLESLQTTDFKDIRYRTYQERDLLISYIHYVIKFLICFSIVIPETPVLLRIVLISTFFFTADFKSVIKKLIAI